MLCVTTTMHAAEMNLIIRPSRDEDVAALHGFYTASVETETASWEYDPPDLAEFTRRRADILAKGYHPYLTAELDGGSSAIATLQRLPRTHRLPLRGRGFDLRRSGDERPWHWQKIADGIDR